MPDKKKKKSIYTKKKTIGEDFKEKLDKTSGAKAWKAAKGAAMSKAYNLSKTASDYISKTKKQKSYR